MNETERDRRLDAAWSAASREEPAPELDAAIRAAARRAVDAAPVRKRNKHWWYPLASAAMVAVLAVAIVQLTPPEKVSPTIVADSTVAQRAAPKEVVPSVSSGESAGASSNDVAPSAPSKEAAATARPAEKPSAEPPAADSTAPVPTPQQAPARRAQGAATATPARQRAEAAAVEDDANKRSYTAKRELDAQDKLASVKRDGGATNAAAPSSASVDTPLASPAPPAAVGSRMSEPFPAAPPEPRRDQYAEERKPAANAAARLEAREAVPSAALREGERSAAPREVAPSAAPPSSQEAQKIKSRVLMAKITAHDEARAKDASGRSVEEWIKRIRDLKREGRVDEAAKEIAAFRTAYGERADALLPADLREK